MSVLDLTLLGHTQNNATLHHFVKQALSFDKDESRNVTIY